MTQLLPGVTQNLWSIVPGNMPPNEYHESIPKTASNGRADECSYSHEALAIRSKTLNFGGKHSLTLIFNFLFLFFCTIPYSNASKAHELMIRVRRPLLSEFRS